MIDWRGGFRTVFLNRHRELRAGWKIALCVIGLTVVTGIFSAPLALMGIKNQEAYTGAGLAAAIGVSIVLTVFLNRKPWPSFGIWFHRRTAREFGLGVLLGFLMMAGIFVVEWLLGYAIPSWRGLDVGAVLWLLTSSFLFFSIAAAFEEVLFRGYLFQTLTQGISFLPAMITMSALFGLGHLSNPHANWFSTLNVFLAGVWLSFAYQKTRGLWFPFGLHVAWNFSQTTLFGFPTSGIDFSDRTLLTLTQSGPDWVTGGPFGPEGGILATVALIGGTWYLLKTPLLTAVPGIITLDSLEDVLPAEAQNDPKPEPEQPGTA